MKEKLDFLSFLLSKNVQPLGALLLVIGWILYVDYQKGQFSQIREQWVMEEFLELRTQAAVDRKELEECYQVQMQEMIHAINRNTDALNNLSKKN